MAPPLLRLDAVRRRFLHHGQPLDVLQGIDLEVAAGERVAITGPSGAGKSTLLGILGLIDDEFEGRYEFEGRDVKRIPEAERARLRLTSLGFAFQDLHLVPSLTSDENVALPAVAAGKPLSQALERARQLLAWAGLEGRGDHGPAELSGGERRRVAFARALANLPRVLLVDEPTGELDDESAMGVLALIDRASSEGAAVVAVTHDPRLVAWSARRFELRHGVLHAGAETAAPLGRA